MSHNPIKATHKVKPLSSFTADLQTFGVVFAGKRPYKDKPLNSGDKVRAALTPLTIYEVDAKTHPTTLRLNLTCNGEDEDDFFDTTVSVRYKVTDPLYMVKEGVDDTEKLAEDVIKPLLTQKAGELRLNQHQQAKSDFQTIIKNAHWEDFGLHCEGVPEVTINLHKDQREKIQSLKGKHMRTHKHDLNSKEPLYSFQVEVDVTYAMDNPDALTRPLDAAEELLFKQSSERVLREVCQQHNVGELNTADSAMQVRLDRLASEGLKDFGVQITSMNVRTDLGEAARKRRQELADVRHENDVRAAKNENAAHELEGLKGTALEGPWALRLLAVARGEMKLTDLISQASEHEREMYMRQITIWNETRKGDNPIFTGIDSDLLERISKQLITAPPPVMLPGKKKKGAKASATTEDANEQESQSDTEADA